MYKLTPQCFHIQNTCILKSQENLCFTKMYQFSTHPWCKSISTMTDHFVVEAYWQWDLSMHIKATNAWQGRAAMVWKKLSNKDLPTGNVCIQRLLLDVSFMGMREGAKGFINARCGVYPPGRMCSMDSALPTWNLPGALESRCWDSSIFSRTSATQSSKLTWD